MESDIYVPCIPKRAQPNWLDIDERVLFCLSIELVVYLKYDSPTFYTNRQQTGELSSIIKLIY